MDEIEFFTKIIRLVENISDEGIVKMLSSTTAVVNHLTNTEYYKDIENEVRDGTFEFKAVGELMESLDIDPKQKPDAYLIVWLAGFRAAASSNDAHHMLFQTSVFIASQRLGIYRIANDKIRLIMTYMHMTALQGLIPS